MMLLAIPVDATLDVDPRTGVANVAPVATNGHTHTGPADASGGFCWCKFTSNLPLLVISGSILSRLLVVTGVQLQGHSAHVPGGGTAR